MKTKLKNTRKAFASMDNKLRKMRQSDPIQFDVLFCEWRRMREGATSTFEVKGIS